jgi:hypothetical protein
MAERTTPRHKALASLSLLSWYFDDSSHRDGLMRGLDGEQHRVRQGLGSGDTAHTQVQGPPRGR